MTNNKWINEYIQYLFPINISDIKINEAMCLKKKKIPKKLFKYKRFDSEGHSIDSFINNYLFCAKASKLNDPYECALQVYPQMPEAFESFRNKFYTISKTLSLFPQDFLESIKNCSIDDFFNIIASADKEHDYSGEHIKFVFECLTNYQKEINDSKISLESQNHICIGALSENINSTLMWSHYGDEHKGFCIEYDFNIADKKYWVPLHPVIYQNDIPDFSKYMTHKNRLTGLVIATYASMIKAQDWKYEKEWRIILPYINNEKNAEKTGVKFRLPTPKALYLGCRCNEENSNKIVSKAQEMNVPVFKMKHKPQSFLLEYESI